MGAPMNLDDIVAIDFHTHAEEACGMHADDGYDDLQDAMARYFRSPFKSPPTVPETAQYYRERRIAAVIFHVDAEAATGHRRYNNEDIATLAAEHSDVLRSEERRVGKEWRARWWQEHGRREDT